MNWPGKPIDHTSKKANPPVFCATDHAGDHHSDHHKRPYDVPFPSTRYQGSKRKLTEWIWANVADLAFDSVLDLFGGTGCVSHLFKTAGKRVIYNDHLCFNWHIGLALIENGATRLNADDVALVLDQQPGVTYPDFIQRTFGGIYFTDAENAWLDRVITHIDHRLADPVKQALARFAVYQACIIKRPYNLFHRANLYMRHADVRRSFGNKTTWDTPFETHFRAFVAEANAAVCDNGRDNAALCGDALDAPTNVDLVYIDPPYVSGKGTGVDYYAFYHFLEGLADYANWRQRIDYSTKHRQMQRQPSPWTCADQVTDAFEAVIARYRDSILVISYRGDGIPARDTLVDLLRQYKGDVFEAGMAQHYVLSKRASRELLLIAP
ncbi:MAG: DNA adenine methylase [Anaerolineae bacterium]|nr:DNA adenine methylase [Anaerolineae bacterium]